MTVAELLAQLAKLDGGTEALIAVDQSFVPIVGLTPATGGSMVVIRGKGKSQSAKRFSVLEDGVLGHLARLGLSDTEIGEVLGRSSMEVGRRRKKLNIATK